MHAKVAKPNQLFNIVMITVHKLSVTFTDKYVTLTLDLNTFLSLSASLMSSSESRMTSAISICAISLKIVVSRGRRLSCTSQQSTLKIPFWVQKVFVMLETCTLQALICVSCCYNWKTRCRSNDAFICTTVTRGQALCGTRSEWETCSHRELPPQLQNEFQFTDCIGVTRCQAASVHFKPLWPVSRKSRKLFGPEKPFVKLRPAYSVKLVFSYVVQGIKIKITAKFRASRRLRFQDTNRIMSPEMGPKTFGTFEKRAPGPGCSKHA